MVTHASLTGSDLHEPKGIDSANSGEVYIADGSGSGDWSALSDINPFANNFAHYREQRTAGTSSTLSISSGTWGTVPLNTEVTDEIGLTLSSSTLLLTSGTYHAKAIVPIRFSSDARGFKGRLYSITDGSSLVVGPVTRSLEISVSVPTIGSGNIDLEDFAKVFLEGRFTIAASKTVSLQVYSSGGTGLTMSSVGGSEVEVYGELYLWKLS